MKTPSHLFRAPFINQFKRRHCERMEPLCQYTGFTGALQLVELCVYGGNVYRVRYLQYK